MSGVTAAGVAAAATVASAAVSIGTGVAGMSDGDSGGQGTPGQYIKPTVTAKEANAQNAKVLAAINKAIRKNRKYQERLERIRHAEVRGDINWFRDAREGAVELADPYVKERAGYIEKMKMLMEDPTSFLEKSPEYKARMAGGLEALTSGLASKGLIGSGNVAIEAQALGAREASGQLGRDWERLAKLSGLMDADLGAAANIQGGGLVPRQGEYTPQFEGEQRPMFQFEQGQQLNPGPQLPDNRIAYADEIGGGLGSLAALLQQYQRSQQRFAGAGGGGGGGY